MHRARQSAVSRALHIKAPEDVAVEALCERHGYGAVMDAAARLWAVKDSMGAFYIADNCLGVKDLAAADKENRENALNELADLGQEFDND